MKGSFREHADVEPARQLVAEVELREGARSGDTADAPDEATDAHVRLEVEAVGVEVAGDLDGFGREPLDVEARGVGLLHGGRARRSRCLRPGRRGQHDEREGASEPKQKVPQHAPTLTRGP